jgi:hypothetical protein
MAKGQTALAHRSEDQLQATEMGEEIVGIPWKIPWVYNI